MDGRMKRKQLKKIIKECLFEILIEGLGTESLLEHTQQPAPRRVSPPSQRSQDPTRNELMAMLMQQKAGNDRFDPSLDTPISQKPRQNNTKALVENSISKLTNDPVMSQIFADTAAHAAASGVKMNSTSTASAMQQMNTPQTDIPLDAIASLGGVNPASWSAMAFTDSKK
jgi:hypothetical protein